jgi:hypothetical protein
MAGISKTKSVSAGFFIELILLPAMLAGRPEIRFVPVLH